MSLFIPSTIGPVSVIRLKLLACVVVCLALLSHRAAATEVIDFRHLALEAESSWNGSDLTGGFSSRGAAFNNDYDSEWDTWSGWAYSNVNDTETRGYLNQFAAIAGGSSGADGLYGVAYVNDWKPVIPTIELPASTRPKSITITNTTYAYYSMLEGDAFTDPFTTEKRDWFLLTIKGKDAEGGGTGEVDIYLADYRFDDPEDAYIVKDWIEVDLSHLEEGTRAIELTLTSSDTGIFGMNTPAYFAMGGLSVLPTHSFKAWMAMLPEEQRPPADMQGATDEPSGDGVSNLLKYAFGVMPMTASVDARPVLSVVSSSVSGGAIRRNYLAMEFQQANAAAVEISLEGSANLVAWDEVSFTLEELGEAGAGNVRQNVRLVSSVATDDYDTYFLRLNVRLRDE